MKNIKRFQIDVDIACGDDEYTDPNPLTIIDLDMDYETAIEGSNIAEITVEDDGGFSARFALGLEHIDVLFEVLTHIKNKVLEQKPDKKE